MSEWRINNGLHDHIVDPNTMVRVRFGTGVESWSSRPAGFYEWARVGSPHDIIEYTVVTE